MAVIEYELIAAHYGDRCARRSGVRLMVHIDDGLALLAGSTDDARRAFCLHPLLQADADLVANLDRVAAATTPRVMALAMEYRAVANAALSTRTYRGPEDIALSPLPEVNAMLRADKIQNYRDFLAHHAGTHPRAAELKRYFELWLARLG
jgi:hypothetical protein